MNTNYKLEPWSILLITYNKKILIQFYLLLQKSHMLLKGEEITSCAYSIIKQLQGIYSALFLPNAMQIILQIQLKI